MPDTLYPPSRPLSVGEVLDLSFRIFGRTFGKSLPFAIVAVIANQLPTLYQVLTGQLSFQPVLKSTGHLGAGYWLVYILALCLTLTMWSAVVVRQQALSSGQSLTGGEALATGLRRLPGMFLIAIVVGLGIGVWFLPAGIVAGATKAISPAGLPIGSPGALMSVALLALLALIAASWVMVRWSAAGLGYLLSDRGPMESVGYSWDLTAGNFWRLSGIYAVGFVLLIVLYAFAGMIGGMLSLFAAHGDVGEFTIVMGVTVVLLGAVATPYYGALLLAVFGDLQVRKEGTDLAQRLSAPAAP